MTTVFGVTGATGLLGGAVAARLAAAGAEQRLLVRDPSRAPELPGARAVPISGYGDLAGMRAALSGVDTVFLVSAHESADRVGLHTTAIDAAVDAGVRRVVYVSFLDAAPDAVFTFGRDHWATEQHILATGLRSTFLRDSFYHLMFVNLVGEDGVIRGPAGSGRVATIAHDDIADAAAAVLLDRVPDLDELQTYDLTGPQALSMAEAAAQLTRVTGRPITYHPESVPEAYDSRARYDAEPWEVDGWVTSYTAIATGEMEVVSAAVERLTGHHSQTFGAWLRANPRTWEHLRAG